MALTRWRVGRLWDYEMYWYREDGSQADKRALFKRLADQGESVILQSNASGTWITVDHRNIKDA
jgi:hypothetical protein